MRYTITSQKSGTGVILPVACALALALPVSLQAQKKGGTPPPAYEYSLTQVSQPGGTYRNVGGPSDLNNSGSLAGFAAIPAQTTWIPTGCLWVPTVPNGSVFSTFALPPLAGDPNSWGIAISDDGLVTGTSAEGAEHSAVWWENTPNGYIANDWNRPEFISPEMGVHLRRASAVTDDGLYIAFEGLTTDTARPVTVIGAIDYNDGRVSDLTVVDLIAETRPVDINHSAGTVRVVGSTTSSGYAFYWKKEGDSVPVTISSSIGYTVGMSVNSLGMIAGSQGPTYSPRKAFVWNESQLWHELGESPIQTVGDSHASAINDLSQVAGAAVTSGKTPQTRAFIWADDGRGIRDLNTLAPAGKLLLQTPLRINNNGQVLIRAEESRLSNTHVLLTPLP